MLAVLDGKPVRQPLISRWLQVARTKLLDSEMGLSTSNFRNAGHAR